MFIIKETPIFEKQRIVMVGGGYTVEVMDKGVTVKGAIKRVDGGFAYHHEDGSFVGFYTLMSENALIDFFYSANKEAK